MGVGDNGAAWTGTSDDRVYALGAGIGEVGAYMWPGACASGG